MSVDERVQGILSGRPVFVTGAGGFIGSHLTDVLVQLGARVHVFIRASARGVPNLSSETLEKITVHWGNLTDPYSIRTAIAAFGRDCDGDGIVFHIAAQAHVGLSWSIPLQTFLDNTIGTLNLLQAIVDEGLNLYRFDLAGTSEEFGNISEGQREFYRFRDDGVVVFDDRSPINPLSPYATSKVAADFLGKNYFLGYGLPVVSTRMFNNFGPRQSPRYFTASVITQALSRDVVVMGHPDATRDYTYVMDGVFGHLYAATLGEPGQTYAYGYGQDVRNRDWADLILRVGRDMGMWGEKDVVVDPRRFRPGDSEVLRLGVDHSRFTRETGWHTQFSREEALCQTISYYDENRANWLGAVDWR